MTSINRRGPRVDPPATVIASRFKTKICTKFTDTGSCPYGTRCMFAHGEGDLRSKDMNVADGLTTEEAVKGHQRKLKIEAAAVAQSIQHKPFVVQALQVQQLQPHPPPQLRSPPPERQMEDWKLNSWCRLQTLLSRASGSGDLPLWSLAWSPVCGNAPLRPVSVMEVEAFTLLVTTLVTTEAEDFPPPGTATATYYCYTRLLQMLLRIRPTTLSVGLLAGPRVADSEFLAIWEAPEASPVREALERTHSRCRVIELFDLLNLPMTKETVRELLRGLPSPPNGSSALLLAFNENSMMTPSSLAACRQLYTHVGDALWLFSTALKDGAAQRLATAKAMIFYVEAAATCEEQSLTPTLQACILRCTLTTVKLCLRSSEPPIRFSDFGFERFCKLPFIDTVFRHLGPHSGSDVLEAASACYLRFNQLSQAEDSLRMLNSSLEATGNLSGDPKARWQKLCLALAEARMTSNAPSPSHPAPIALGSHSSGSEESTPERHRASGVLSPLLGMQPCGGDESKGTETPREFSQHFLDFLNNIDDC